jgi:hypothetical protein
MAFRALAESGATAAVSKYAYSFVTGKSARVS